MKIGPRYKICKRLGNGVFEKCQTQKFALSEARSQKQKKRRKNQSDYGRQLLEKQKVRFSYGLTEKQLARYVQEANTATVPTDTLYSSLESRLDNVVFRTGLSKTRRGARQLVAHGHITVNGRKVTIPSYRVQPGDVFAVRDGSKGKTVFTTMQDSLKEHTAPAWVAFKDTALSGTVMTHPTYVASEVVFDYPAVFEFYSR